MMKISDMGKFVLVDENEYQHALFEGTNLICIKDNEIYTGNKVINHLYNADTIFIIVFVEESIILIKSKGKIYVNDKEVEHDGCELADGVKIKTNSKNIEFKFICDNDALEKIIDIFMDGNLNYSLDMDVLFLEYAKKIGITDKKAILNIMAAIDIPEIDKL